MKHLLADAQCILFTDAFVVVHREIANLPDCIDLVENCQTDNLFEGYIMGNIVKTGIEGKRQVFIILVHPENHPFDQVTSTPTSSPRVKIDQPLHSLCIPYELRPI